MADGPDPEQSIRDRIMEKEQQRREASDEEDRQLNEEIREHMHREAAGDLTTRLQGGLGGGLPNYHDHLVKQGKARAKVEAKRIKREKRRTDSLTQLELSDRTNRIWTYVAIGIAIASLLVSIVGIFLF